MGSTAIHGIPAKSILDVAVVIKSFAALDYAHLLAAGYECIGKSEPERLVLRLHGAGGLILQHIPHFFISGAQKLSDMPHFRGSLNAHPEYAREYAALKKQLTRELAE